MNQMARIFVSLEGKWLFNRIISGHGRIAGTATFKMDSTECNTLHYREEGQWEANNGKCHRVYREYYYRLQKGTIAVYFAEEPEKLLHILECIDLEKKNSATEATGVHQCANDLYAATYRFFHVNKFTLTYSVEGPQKSYTIYTEFTRI